MSFRLKREIFFVEVTFFLRDYRLLHYLKKN